MDLELLLAKYIRRVREVVPDAGLGLGLPFSRVDFTDEEYDLLYALYDRICHEPPERRSYYL